MHTDLNAERMDLNAELTDLNANRTMTEPIGPNLSPIGIGHKLLPFLVDLTSSLLAHHERDEKRFISQLVFYEQLTKLINENI